jgi:hypothetical protein
MQTIQKQSKLNIDKVQESNEYSQMMNKIHSYDYIQNNRKTMLLERLHISH